MRLNQSRSCMLWIVVMTASSHAGGVRYVDDDAPLGGDGLAWTTAYRHLQEGLAAALASGGAVTEIRVAQGVQTPDRDEAGGVTPGDRAASFELHTGLAIGGGYRGAFDGSGKSADDRDPAVFVSTLSGDLAGDDRADFVNYVENSLHVIDGNGVSNVTLEGLRVSGGNADGSSLDDQGGGINLWDSVITVIDCQIIDNRADDDGGGVADIDCCGPSVMSGTLLSGNFAGASGGGMYGYVTATDCTFRDNTADSGGGFHENGTGTFDHCTFEGNVAMTAGGAVRLQFSDAARDCVFRENRSFGEGGAIYFWNPDGQAQVMRCEFVANHSSLSGGGIYVNSGLTVVSCVFSHNRSDNAGGAIYATSFSAATGCAFYGNSGLGAGAVGSGGPGLFDLCTFAYNDSATAAGAATTAGPATFGNCVIWQNESNLGDDEIGPGHTVLASIVRGGYPGSSNLGDDPMFADAHSGTWTQLDTYDAVTDTTTFYDDNASMTPGALVDLALVFHFAQLTDSAIVVSNTATTITVMGEWALWTIIDAPYEVTRFELRQASPGVDTGQNGLIPDDLDDLDEDGDVDELLPLDLLGNPRIADASGAERSDCSTQVQVDRGAYEFQGIPAGDPPVIGDMTDDGIVDVNDLLVLLAYWGPCEEVCCPGGFRQGHIIGTPELLALLANWS